MEGDRIEGTTDEEIAGGARGVVERVPVVSGVVGLVGGWLGRWRELEERARVEAEVAGLSGNEEGVAGGERFTLPPVPPGIPW